MQGERFKHLAQRFLIRTSEELVQFEALLTVAQQGDAHALLSIQHMAHRINGSGAMLGFKSVSEQAAHIEHMLRRSENSPAPEEWPVILDHFSRLGAALREASADSIHDGE